MWHPLSSLFKNPQRAGWAEMDIRYVVQDYLRGELQSDAVSCEVVKDGRAIVHVSSPALIQQVRLITFDVQKAVRDRTGYELKEVVVQR